jgi:hypothetical protein
MKRLSTLIRLRGVISRNLPSSEHELFHIYRVMLEKGAEMYNAASTFQLHAGFSKRVTVYISMKCTAKASKVNTVLNELINLN